jgi:hypothetical protein
MSEEEDEEAAAAELARLEAEVVRWQREVKELADAKDGLLPGVAEARQELFADAEEELKGAEGAKEVAQIAMQRRLGKLDKSTPGGKSKAPPMMVMRPMTGPPKTPR